MSAAKPSGSGFVRAIKDLPDRTPLWVKLITAVLVLVTAALAVISVAGIGVLRGYLLHQYDTELGSLAANGRFLENQIAFVLGGGERQPASYSVQWLPSHGPTVQTTGQVVGYDSTGQPITKAIVGPTVTRGASWLSNGLTPSTVGSANGGRWRVISAQVVLRFPFSSKTATGTIIIGVNVSSVYQTVGELTAVDLIISGVLLVILAILAIALIRASMRQLADIERTAAAIAAGDLSRRVPERDPRTEVGRLGRAINTMLARIETSFQARTASEEAARRSEDAARRSALAASRSEDRLRRFVADASHELRTPLTALRGYAEYYRQRGGVEPASTNGEPAPQANTPGRGAAWTEEQPREPKGAAPSGLTSEARREDSALKAPGGERGEYSDEGRRHLEAPRQAGAGGSGGSPPDGQSGGSPPRAETAKPASKLTRSDLDHLIQRVEQEATRMGVLVDDMLLLARLDQERSLDFRTVDLLAIAADALNDARVIAPDRSITLTVSTPDAALVQGDEAGLRQVVGNLLSNAIMHTRSGTPIEITIRVAKLTGERAPGDPAEPAVVLEVTDQGPGLSAEQTEHVFERFYRTDRARSRSAGGTGLGLAIVSALVIAHHGKVWVDSTPGRGATFGFALPLAPEARLTNG